MPRLAKPTRSLTLLLAPMLLTSCAVQQQSPALSPFIHETTDQYSVQQIEGFTVHVSHAATGHPESTAPALDLLRRQLKQTLAQTPESSHEILQQTHIWIEHNNPGFPCACYHPDAGWLADNDYNTDKATGIEIANTVNFVNWINTGQPSMILHELAHAYQHATLGYNNPLVTQPYQRAKDSETYDLVDHISGTPRIHYAMNNEIEYFAELTESYFGFNDFYPFSRDQLKAHDPDGYSMIQHAWHLRDEHTE
jgi:hypothetical protein